MVEQGWRVIDDNTPRDESILVYVPRIYGTGRQYIARWDPDKYAKRPKPRFRSSDRMYGDADSALFQPTHWRPLPAPPEAGDG